MYDFVKSLQKYAEKRNICVHTFTFIMDFSILGRIFFLQIHLLFLTLFQKEVDNPVVL